MRTLYYVNAGASWFGFYLDEGALALANDGARFNSFGAVLAWAGEHTHTAPLCSMNQISAALLSSPFLRVLAT